MQGWVQQSRCLTRYLLWHTGVCLAAVSKGERQPVPPSTEGDGEGVKGQHPGSRSASCGHLNCQTSHGHSAPCLTMEYLD